MKATYIIRAAQLLPTNIMKTMSELVRVSGKPIADIAKMAHEEGGSPVEKYPAGLPPTGIIAQYKLGSISTEIFFNSLADKLGIPDKMAAVQDAWNEMCVIPADVKDKIETFSQRCFTAGQEITFHMINFSNPSHNDFILQQLSALDIRENALKFTITSSYHPETRSHDYERMITVATAIAEATAKLEGSVSSVSDVEIINLAEDPAIQDVIVHLSATMAVASPILSASVTATETETETDILESSNDAQILEDKAKITASLHM